MASDTPTRSLLRLLPPVDKLVQALGDGCGLPRALLVHQVREEVALMRGEAAAGREPPPFELAIERVRRRIESLARCRIQPVINGTGVLLHTNLGRAPLLQEAGEAVRRAACAYSNLELDPETGGRGARGRFLEIALAALTGAESATVTNNCAAALVLVLRHLTAGGKNEVIISRGQLIEIGGGFRIPEIMETSGASLREVGATNRVTLADYRKAIGPQTALILRVHRSNFYMEGFTGEPETPELAALGSEFGLPVVEDLGSGAVIHTDHLAALEHEPTPQERLAQGADLVCFSGDKLFGGPQAGIICGRQAMIAGIKRDPMFRALRCDKLILTALEETTLDYLRHAQGEDSGPFRLPLLQMLAVSAAALEARARVIVQALSGLPLHAAVGQGISRCGGGTMPRSSLDSVTVDIAPHHQSLEGMALRLRHGAPAVISCIAGGLLKIDLRTVFDHQDAALTAAIRAAAV